MENDCVKQLASNIPVIDNQLDSSIKRLNTLIRDLNIGVYGSFDTSDKKDDESPKLEPSLRTLADKAQDISNLLNSVESLCSNIRSTEEPVCVSN